MRLLVLCLMKAARVIRSRTTIWLLIFSLLVLISFAAQSGKPREDFALNNWSQFRGNPQLTGVTASALPDTLKVLWTFEAGESVESSAAIADGTVYVGSQSGELTALDLQKGAVRWKYRAKEAIGESSPCVGNGIVYVGDLSGTLHAINSRDGNGLWTYKTGGEIKSSPVLVEDRVLVGSYDEHLYCISARKGELIWRFKSEGPVHCTAGVLGGMTYISGCDETFRAIQISDGKEVFKVASGGYTGASPALMTQAAYFGTFNNEVLKMDLRARSVVWRYQPAERQFPFYSSAAVVGNQVIVGGRDKLIHCLNAKTGKPLWTFTTRARVESSPAVAGNRVFVGSNDGRFYVLNLTNGSKLWEFDAGAPLSASPAIAAGRVVIGSQDGRIYCFG